MRMMTINEKIQLPLDNASDDVISVWMSVGFNVNCFKASLSPTILITFIENTRSGGHYMDEISLITRTAKEVSSYMAGKYKLTAEQQKILCDELESSRQRAYPAYKSCL